MKKRRKGGATVIQEFNLFEESGEQILHSVKRRKVTLGGGWMAFYKRALRKFNQDCPNLSTYKVYMHLASKQTYQKFVLIAPVAIEKDLNMAHKTVFDALKWLQTQGYIQKCELDGNIAWLLNPNVTTQGAKTRYSKQELWRMYRDRQSIMESIDLNVEERLKLCDELDKLIVKEISEGDDDDELQDVEVEANREYGVHGED